MFKQVYSIPENFQEGEVFIRARGDSAKCLACNNISLLLAWEANVDPSTTIEKCPSCHVAALTMDPTTQLPVIASLKKQIMGSTLRMTPQAEFSYQADNIMAPEKGDTQNIFKLYINGKTGEVSFMNASKIAFQSSGQFVVGCDKFIVKANTSILESTPSKTLVSTAGDGALVESCQTRSISALARVSISAPSINETASGIMSLTAADRQVSLGTLLNPGTDSLETGSQTHTITGDASGTGRVVQIGTSDKKTVPFLTDVLDNYGSEVTTIYGAQAVTVVGASSWKVGGPLAISGNPVVLNGGIKPVARVGDYALSSAVSDVAFWAFIEAMSAFLSAFITDGAAVSPPMTATVAAATAAVALLPSSMKSLITLQPIPPKVLA
jgi:hypothetical protein